MDEDVIRDLKQFIAATVSQESALIRSELRTEFRAEISKLENKLSTKIDNLAQHVAEALEAGNEATDAQFKNHEKRITYLERIAAAEAHKQ